jgi:uncharacterized membrane protein
MDMMMQGGMAVMMVLGTLFWLLVLVALGAGVWWLVRRERPAPAIRRSTCSASATRVARSRARSSRPGGATSRREDPPEPWGRLLVLFFLRP